MPAPEGFWKLYRFARDKEDDPHVAAAMRIRRGNIIFEYVALVEGHGMRYIERCHAGHVRAALLSAARDDRAVAVRIGFRYQACCPAEHLAQIRREIWSEFPASFEINALARTNCYFLVSLYAARELKLPERIRIGGALAPRAAPG